VASTAGGTPSEHPIPRRDDRSRTVGREIEEAKDRLGPAARAVFGKLAG
jgi:hypothetical protein